MLLGKEPQFVRRLGSIWDSVIHITNLDTLRECMMNSILVAFDIEGHVASINEVGMAYLHVSEAKPLRASQDGTLRTFHSQNAIQAYTIMVWEMRSKRRHEAIKYGDHVTVHRDVVCETLDQTLSSVEQRSRQLILVGYDMYTEFDWISRENPTFLSRFKYWVDVQELVEASCGSRPSHFNTMAAMNITDWNPTNSPPSGHRASNDAVRALATLSTLVSLGKFEYQRVVATRLFSSSPRNWDNYPFKARVTTRDKDMLPACIKTPRALSSHFAAYEPVAVLINKRAATKGVRVWWICVPTRDLLEKLAADMNGSVLGGKELNIEKVIASWIADRQGRQHQGIKSAASDRTHLQQNFEMEDFEIDI
ncbi:MAG: hypothetical protein M1822_003410 [Bathelium mastoideum]|nr:MAG: hypothetical protein M1822_003410 [Bathelium mastoideum]